MAGIKMRTLTDHKINLANDLIQIEVHSGFQGEPSIYRVKLPAGGNTELVFQLGPIGEVGVNGLTNEALLAIVLDRLRWFQENSLPCRENALAITKIEEGLQWLHTRTRRRIEAGVEGTKLPG